MATETKQEGSKTEDGAMNEAIEDAAYASAFMRKLTEPATPAPTAELARQHGENRAAHRERLRREKAASKRLAKARS